MMILPDCEGTRGDDRYQRCYASKSSLRASNAPSLPMSLQRWRRVHSSFFRRLLHRFLADPLPVALKDPVEGAVVFCAA
jgi:hypothetical protein